MSTNTRPNAQRARSAGRQQAESIANPEQHTEIAAVGRFVEVHGDRARKDAAFLDEARQRVHASMRGIVIDGGPDDA